MNEDVVNNVPQFLPIANNQKNRSQFKLNYLLRLCIIYQYYFITFTELF